MAITHYYTAELETSVHNVWILRNTPSVRIPKYVKCRYKVKVWKKEVTLPPPVPASITQLSNVPILSSAGIIVSATKAGSGAASVTMDSVSLNILHNEFYFEFKSNTAPANFRATIAVTRNHPTNNPVNVFQATPAQALAGTTKVQTVNFSKINKGTPSPPMFDAAGNETAFSLAIDGKIKSSKYKWDDKTNEWVVIIEGSIPNSSDKNFFNEFYTIDGVFKSKTAATKGKNHKDPKVKAVQVRLLEAMQNSVTREFADTPTTSSPPKDSPGGWNPPNNALTRRPRFVGYSTPIFNEYRLFQTGTRDTGVVPLGTMIQDTEFDSNFKKVKGKEKNNPYGFRFTYNPTTISYSTSSDTPLDYTISREMDPSTILGGPTIVNFQLYLNRIADLADLTAGTTRNYPGGVLSEEDRLGLLHRGTEYDLEFLYRIVNGPPVAGLPLLSYEKGESSDFGYITGIPFWLRLHNNLKYYGGLSGLRVEHRIFSTKMVPILSIVDITFNRYPKFEGSGGASQAYRDKQTLVSLETTATAKELAKIRAKP